MPTTNDRFVKGLKSLFRVSPETAERAREEHRKRRKDAGKRLREELVAYAPPRRSH